MTPMSLCLRSIAERGLIFSRAVLTLKFFRITSMSLLKIFLVAALHFSQASVWAQPFGSQAVESERLKNLSKYGEKLRKSIEDIENERKNFLSLNLSSAKSDAEAKKLREVIDILSGHLRYFEDTLGASNVIFSAIAIAMNVENKNKQVSVAGYIQNICIRMPGEMNGSLIPAARINEWLKEVHSTQRKSLTKEQNILVTNGLETAHSLRKAMDELCARGSEPKNWAVR